MTSAKGKRTWEFTALNDLWTGSVDGKHDRLITTGLLGSIRWWFEILVRGLGGSACDPTNTKCEDRNHCVVCEFFGCTGWARKFRFDVLDEKGNIKTNQIRKGDEFQLRFTPLRPIRNEEWTLLDATFRLITEYGAIGGKTVFKPTDESRRASKLHHKDFGLIEIKESPKFNEVSRVNLNTYLSKWRKFNHGEFAWASLQHFWCVNGKYLARQDGKHSTFNRAIERPENKQQSAKNDSWLAGCRPNRKKNIKAKSKKVFSFKNPPRTFGFVKPGVIGFDAMKKRLQDVWGEGDWKFLKGDKIIDQLFVKEEDRS